MSKNDLLLANDEFFSPLFSVEKFYPIFKETILEKIHEVPKLPNESIIDLLAEQGIIENKQLLSSFDCVLIEIAISSLQKGASLESLLNGMKHLLYLDDDQENCKYEELIMFLGISMITEQTIKILLFEDGHVLIDDQNSIDVLEELFNKNHVEINLNLLIKKLATSNLIPTIPNEIDEVKKSLKNSQVEEITIERSDDNFFILTTQPYKEGVRPPLFGEANIIYRNGKLFGTITERRKFEMK